MEQPGSPAPLVARFTKWGGRPHWHIPGVRLGEDEHGTWLGIPSGTRLSRPGSSYVTAQPTVTVLHPARWSVSTFYPDLNDPPVAIYVDVCTPPVFSADGTEVTSVDLDLDVVKGCNGRVWVDDEDEFAQHRSEFGYPDDVVGAALRSCEQVRRDVTDGAPPYDGTAAAWLALLL